MFYVSEYYKEVGSVVLLINSCVEIHNYYGRTPRRNVITLKKFIKNYKKDYVLSLQDINGDYDIIPIDKNLTLLWGKCYIINENVKEINEEPYKYAREVLQFL